MAINLINHATWYLIEALKNLLLQEFGDTFSVETTTVGYNTGILELPDGKITINTIKEKDNEGNVTEGIKIRSNEYSLNNTYIVEDSQTAGITEWEKLISTIFVWILEQIKQKQMENENENDDIDTLPSLNNDGEGDTMMKHTAAEEKVIDVSITTDVHEEEGDAEVEHLLISDETLDLIQNETLQEGIQLNASDFGLALLAALEDSSSLSSYDGKTYIDYEEVGEDIFKVNIKYDIRGKHNTSVSGNIALEIKKNGEDFELDTSVKNNDASLKIDKDSLLGKMNSMAMAKDHVSNLISELRGMLREEIAEKEKNLGETDDDDVVMAEGEGGTDIIIEKGNQNIIPYVWRAALYTTVFMAVKANPYCFESGSDNIKDVKLFSNKEHDILLARFIYKEKENSEGNTSNPKPLDIYLSTNEDGGAALIVGDGHVFSLGSINSVKGICAIYGVIKSLVKAYRTIGDLLSQKIATGLSDERESFLVNISKSIGIPIAFSRQQVKNMAVKNHEKYAYAYIGADFGADRPDEPSGPKAVKLAILAESQTLLSSLGFQVYQKNGIFHVISPTNRQKIATIKISTQYDSLLNSRVDLGDNYYERAYTALPCNVAPASQLIVADIVGALLQQKEAAGYPNSIPDTSRPAQDLKNRQQEYTDTRYPENTQAAPGTVGGVAPVPIPTPGAGPGTQAPTLEEQQGQAQQTQNFRNDLELMKSQYADNPELLALIENTQAQVGTQNTQGVATAAVYSPSSSGSVEEFLAKRDRRQEDMGNTGGLGAPAHNLPKQPAQTWEEKLELMKSQYANDPDVLALINSTLAGIAKQKNIMNSQKIKKEKNTQVPEQKQAKGFAEYVAMLLPFVNKNR